MFCQVVVFSVLTWYNKRSMQHTNASKTARLPSLIETITQGFEAVNRRLWVVPVLFALDLFYWLGPRISLQPLVDRWLRFLQTLSTQNQEQLGQQMEMLEQLSRTGASLNLGRLDFINWTNTLMPSIIESSPLAATWQVSSIAVLLGVVVLLNLMGLLVKLLYLMPLADLIRGAPLPLPPMRRVVKAFASLLGIVMIILGIMLLFCIPFALLIGLTSLISPVLGSLVMSLWLAFVIWLLFTAWFSFDAVIMSGVGPLRALLTSLFIVQRSFWAAIGLYLISSLIMAGMNVIWQQLSASSPGLVIAMIGSAYLSCGLAAAHLIFYRDRLTRIGRRA
jgi:hypothetical protein